jgi:hypothetical protein
MTVRTEIKGFGVLEKLIYRLKRQNLRDCNRKKTKSNKTSENEIWYGHVHSKNGTNHPQRRE